MPRRLFPLRPKELATTSEKWECEIFVVDKEPIQKRIIKFQLENETCILAKVCYVVLVFEFDFAVARCIYIQ